MAGGRLAQRERERTEEFGDLGRRELGMKEKSRNGCLISVGREEEAPIEDFPLKY
jgi:hypothetical protein